MKLEIVKVRFHWRWKPSLLQLSRTTVYSVNTGTGVSFGRWHFVLWRAPKQAMLCRSCGGAVWQPSKHRCYSKESSK